MIVGVCSDKGAPGVTTLASVLALAWPGERILLEADPSGGDLSLRMRGPRTHYLAREPTVMSLATAVRSGARGASLATYAQESSLGVPVIPGPPMAEAWTPMVNLWAPVAGQVQAWPGTVIADLGRLQPGHPAMALVNACDVVLLLTSAALDGLFHARERARALEEELADPSGHSRVGVVVREGVEGGPLLREVGQILTRPVRVVGGLAHDPGGVSALAKGADGDQLRRSALMRSGADLVTRIRRTWPERARARPPATTRDDPPDQRLAPVVRLLRDVP